MPDDTLYDAVFVNTATGRYYTVGSFHTETEAETFGDTHPLPGQPFVGIADRSSINRFRRSTEAATVDPDTGNPRRWSAVINRWDIGRPHGFATDSTGRSWYITHDQLPAGWKSLAPGTQVTFAGSPHPPNGHKFPRAFTVRLAGTEESPG